MIKKTKFQNIRLSSGISNLSNHVMTLHPVKKEWRVAIVVLLFARIFTMIVAIFAGYSYFYSYIKQITDNPNFILILSIGFLIFVEFFAAYSLEKMFKFFYRQRFFPAAASLLVAILCYGLSFISATEGLASRQAHKKDKSVDIKMNEKKDLTKAEEKIQLLTADYDKQIELIEKNPQGWQNGKRSCLSDNQLKNISKLNEKKEGLQADLIKQTELVKNKTEIELYDNAKTSEATGQKYHKFMTIVMFFQFLVTGILIYLLHLIRSQENKDSIVNEDLKEIADTVEENATRIIFNSIISISNKLTDHVTSSIIADRNKDAYVLNDVHNELQNKEQQKEPVKITGFGAKTSHETGQKTSHKNSTESAESLRYLNDATALNLQYLRKHKAIVFAIKKLKPQLANITNTDIEIIKQSANAQYKSRTLIQKVFMVMKSVPEVELKKILD